MNDYYYNYYYYYIISIKKERLLGFVFPSAAQVNKANR